MEPRGVRRLTEFAHEKVGDDLRAVVAYDEDGFDPVFLRPDDREQYSMSSIDRIMEDARLEALERPVIADAFADDLGDLTSHVKVFDQIIQVNVTLSEAEGVVVAMDRPQVPAAECLLDELGPLPRRNSSVSERCRKRTGDGHAAAPADSRSQQGGAV
jgi:hypothetical protein